MSDEVNVNMRSPYPREFSLFNGSFFGKIAFTVISPLFNILNLVSVSVIILGFFKFKTSPKQIQFPILVLHKQNWWNSTKNEFCFIHFLLRLVYLGVYETEDMCKINYKWVYFIKSPEPVSVSWCQWKNVWCTLVCVRVRKLSERMRVRCKNAEMLTLKSCSGLV